MAAGGADGPDRALAAMDIYLIDNVGDQVTEGRGARARNLIKTLVNIDLTSGAFVGQERSRNLTALGRRQRHPRWSATALNNTIDASWRLPTDVSLSGGVGNERAHRWRPATIPWTVVTGVDTLTGGKGATDTYEVDKRRGTR